MKKSPGFFLIILLTLVFFSGCTTFPVDIPSDNLSIVKGVITDYHNDHTYSANDLFTCSDMSMEVWNILKTKGIRARIVVGNVDRRISDITDSDHAWVVAEISPHNELALECVGGNIVTREQNPLYYSGWFFDSPKELKEFLQLGMEYDSANRRYKKALEDYELSKSQSNYQTVQLRIHDLNDVIVRINTFLADL